MQKENKALNKKVISLLICCISAFALWVYVTYVEDPSLSRWENGVPISFVGEAKLNENGLAVSYISSEKIDVKVSAQRSRFRHLASDSIIATVDLSKITQTGECQLEAAVTLPSDFTIINKRKSTIKLVVEEYVQDKVFTITPLIAKNTENDYFVKSQNIDGKDLQVFVSGAESLINRIASITTSGIDLSTIADDAVISVAFIPVDENGKEIDGVVLSLDGTNSINGANITFVIYKKATLPIEISYQSGGDNPKMVASCDTETVTVTGPASVVDKLTSIQTQAISEYNYKAGSTVDVALVIPEAVTLQNQDNSTVSLTFTKN